MPLILLSHGIRAALAAATGYTATHYVAPFASVAGASNDYDDLGATAWTNAANSGTPTTLGTARARAVAGNKVRCAAGIYVRLWRGDVSGPGFAPANSGTSGNPIVFFCATPAATNRGSSGSWCELRWSGDVPDFTVPGDSVAILGCNPDEGGDYIVFDGWYASRTYVPPFASAGAFTAGKTGIEFRRCYYDYVTTTPAGDNFNAIWLAGSVGARVYDCYFANNFGSGAHNASCIGQYSARDYLIRYCTFENVNQALFIKADTGSGFQNYGVFEYNLVDGGSRHAVSVKHTEAGETNIIRFNLFKHTGGIEYASGGSYSLNRRASRVHNNTFVGGSELGTVLSWDDVEAAGWEDEHEFYNNLLVDDDGTSVDFFWWSEAGLSFGAMFDKMTALDNNVYYKSGGAANFFDTANKTFAQYLTAISGLIAACRETNSSESTVTFVGGGDYRLADNGQDALTASDIGGRVGCYVDNTEEIGIRANPTY